jgi:hypothetical protein
MELEDGGEIQNRFELLDSGVLTDITFLVGISKEPIKAHKAFLISSSDVFKSMICGELREKNAVVVDDIEKEVFLEMLRYIYTKVVDINNNNVFHLMYAANKYLILPLKMLCGKFIATQTNETNALTLFESAHLFDVVHIEKACMDFILKNPYKYFEDSQFLELSKTTLKKIIQQPKINCTSSDLEMFILKWLKHQDPNTPDKLDEQCLMKIGLKISDLKKTVFFDAGLYSSDEYSFQRFQTSRSYFKSLNIKLCGLAIYTGVKTEPFDESIVIKISHFKNVEKGSFVIEKKITHFTVPTIQYIMFPIIECKDDDITITLLFDTVKERAVKLVS